MAQRLVFIGVVMLFAFVVAVVVLALAPWLA
jgi:hypothetical protein